MKTKLTIKCNCGFIRETTPDQLNALLLSEEKSKLKSECRVCRTGRKHKEKSPVQLYNMIYIDYRFQAKRRGYDFTLTPEEAPSLFTSDCHYCGDKPSNVKVHTRNKTIKVLYQGIDRVNPDLPYTNTNTLPCCSTCNYAKRKMTYSEFTAWISKVYSFGVQRLSREGVGPSGSKQRPS